MLGFKDRNVYDVVNTTSPSASKHYIRQPGITPRVARYSYLVLSCLLRDSTLTAIIPHLFQRHNLPPTFPLPTTLLVYIYTRLLTSLPMVRL